MSQQPHCLPSVLRPEPAVRDTKTTAEEIKANGVGRLASPADTPIFICGLDSCWRLFPSRDRLAAHRKRDHDTDDAYESVLTWNEDESIQNETA